MENYKNWQCGQVYWSDLILFIYFFNSSIVLINGNLLDIMEVDLNLINEQLKDMDLLDIEFGKDVSSDCKFVGAGLCNLRKYIYCMCNDTASLKEIKQLI